MTAFLLLVNALVAIAMVVLILLQRTDSTGGGMFGGSAGNQPVVRNPLARPTAVLAAIFMFNGLLIAYTNSHRTGPESIMEAPAAPVAETSPFQSLPEPGAALPAQPAAAPVPAASPEQPVESPTTK